MCWLLIFSNGSDQSLNATPTSVYLGREQSDPYPSMPHVRRLNGLNDRTWKSLSCGLFVCIGLAICLTFLDYGLTYDEEVGQSQELGDRSLSKTEQGRMRTI